ncbi:hypothetical protein [Prosthecobacter sp.]|uniref:hypothetical protein n=1 Tax=Prosthecobacter sp. TaxID=1965333 RepID=UPI0037840EB9
MRACLLPLLALFLVCLLPGTSQAAGQKFARGFVIFKKVPSDQPVHYGGMLFISSKPGPVWYEYDIGQDKPFFLAVDLFVSEINFGSMFEADFTTPKHLEFCKNVIAQLNAAAKQSPAMVSAVKAAVAAIQVEVDRYEKGFIRLNGAWVDRDKYEANLASMQKARMAQDAAQKAAEEEMRASMAKNAAASKVRQDNLTREYVSASSQYLVGKDSFEQFAAEAMAVAKAGGTLPPVLGTDYPGLIELPQYRDAAPMLLQLGGGGGSVTEAAMICAFNDRSQLLAADIVIFLISDAAKSTPVNAPEISALKRFLGKFDPQIMTVLPDVLAADRIRIALDNKTDPSALSVTVLDLPKFTVNYLVGHTVEYVPTGTATSGSAPQRQQLLVLQIRPPKA